MAEATHIVLNGKRLETQRAELHRGDVLVLAGYAPRSEAIVTVREPLSAMASAREVPEGERVVLTRPGMVLEVRARG